MWNNISTNNIIKFHTNINGYYSGLVGRFFAVDSLDLYTAVEAAQILSSKMPGIIICALSPDDIEFNNSNCYEFTISEPLAAGLPSGPLQQFPIIKQVSSNLIKKMSGLPTEMSNGDNYQTFMNFVEYSHFVIRALHSAKLCEIMFNQHPIETYNIDLIAGLVPDNLTVLADNTGGSLTTGITKEIKKILYISNDLNSALAAFSNLWYNNNTPFTIAWRNAFYRFLEIPVPDNIVSLELNLTQYSGRIF